MPEDNHSEEQSKQLEMMSVPEGDGDSQYSGPSFGRRCWRSAVALSVVVSLFAGMWTVLPKWPWWHVGLLVVSAIFVVVALGYLVASLEFKWRQRRRQRRRDRLQRLQEASKTSFRLAPWTDSESDQDCFEREDDVHGKIFKFLRGTNEPIVYVTGHSGVGKTSLMEAYVKPQLKADKAVVVASVRMSNNTHEQLSNALLKRGVLWDRPPQGFSDMRGLLEAAAKRAVKAKRHLVVIVDQFEETIRQFDDDRAGGNELEESASDGNLSSLDEGIALLRSLADEPIDGLTTTLVLRDDWKGNLVDLGLPPLLQDANWIIVDAFKSAVAVKYLMSGGIKRSERAESLIDRAKEVEDSAGGYVRAITANMVGYFAACFPEITQRYAHQRAAGSKYFRQCLKRLLGPGMPKDEVIGILRALITASGDRLPQRTVESLALDMKIKISTTRNVMLDLQKDGLVRRTNDGSWEVSHDFIARVLNGLLEGMWHSWWRVFRRHFVPVVIGLCIAGLFALPHTLSAIEQARLKGAFEASGLTVWRATAKDSPLEREAVTAGFSESDRINEDALRWIEVRTPPIEVVDLNGTRVRNSDLQIIVQNENLKGLVLRNCEHLSNDGLMYLAESKSLQALYLWHCNGIKDAEAESLEKNNLLASGGISDDGLQHLAKLENLESLSLLGCSWVSDDSLKSLGGFMRLKFLDLSHCEGIVGSGLWRLMKLNRLTYLSISHCDLITDDSLIDLRLSEGLEGLDLSHCDRITDAGLVHLAVNRRLMWLDLSNCQGIVGVGLGHVMIPAQISWYYNYGYPLVSAPRAARVFRGSSDSFENLKFLILRNCDGITDDGLACFSLLTGLVSLDLSCCGGITNSGLESVAELENLESLDLRGCDQITAAGVQALQEKRPDLKISWAGQRAFQPEPSP